MVASGNAVLRVFRILAISIGVGSAIFTVLGLPEMISQYNKVDFGYAWTTMVLYGGIPLVSAIVAPRASIGTLRFLARIHAISAPFLLLLWIPALNGGTLAVESTPWIINVIAVAMTTAALSLPTAAAWVYMVLTAALCGIVRFITYGGGNPELAFEDAVMAALFCSVMITLVQLSIQAARKQDQAAFIAEEAAVSSATSASIRKSRAQYEAFAHDEVLGTLLAASRQTNGAAADTIASALNALNKLDAFHDSSSPALPLTADQLEMSLRASAAAADSPIDVLHQEDHPEELLIPADVANALVEALREALRNSALHSVRSDGRAVTRRASAVFGHDSVLIEVSDDGRGFDPRRIGVDRLGVRVSILRRVNSLPGAVATIISTRRGGTTVTLRWNSPEVPHAR